MENVSDKSMQSVDSIVTILERHSKYCNCGSWAPPVAIEGHLYKCLICHESQEGISYNFNRLIPTLSEFKNSSSKPNSEIDYFNRGIDVLRRKRLIVNTFSNKLKRLWKRLKHQKILYLKAS